MLQPQCARVGEGAQKTGRVLRDDLQEGAVGGGPVVEVDAGWDLDLGQIAAGAAAQASSVSTLAVPASTARRLLSTKRVRSVRVELERAKGVGKAEAVDDQARAAFEKASAVTMFMPQAASAPASGAKSMGRSWVTSVSSLDRRHT